MITDYLPAGTNPRKMTVRAQSKDTITCGAAVTLEKKAGRKAAEVAVDVSMTPETIMATAGTSTWSLPLIFFPQLKNILEQSGNKIYHQNTLLKGKNPWK